MTKKSTEEVQYNKIINCAIREVPNFEALLHRWRCIMVKSQPNLM